MSQTKKITQSQFTQLSTKSHIDDESIEVTENQLDQTDYKLIKYLNDEPLKTNNLKNKQKYFGFQSFIVVFIITIMAIALIAFALIAINCMISNRSQQKYFDIDESTKTQISIENATQTTKPKQQTMKQFDRTNKQISPLKMKVADLEFQVQKLQTQLQNEKKKSKQIQDGLYVNPNSTSNQTQMNHQKQNNSQNPKFTVRSASRNDIPPGGNPGDLYEFTISIDQVVSKSPVSYIFTSENSQFSSIKKSQYERAIRLMEVVHNVNFKGQYVLDHYNFYKTPEDKYNALFKIIKEQKQFYNQKYQTDKYIHDQIGICVYIPSFNNANNRLYLRNLDSVFQQEYQNYHVVYVNDASTDGTGQYVKSYMLENGIPEEKYVLINNQKNKGNCANIYIAAHQYCNLGEIMVFLDGDDVLIGRQVFSLLNAVYQKEKVALTYGQFLLVRGNKISSGFSQDIPHKYLEQAHFRQLKGFLTSHLKTMYVDVMRAIKETDLQYANGTYYDYASDVAYMTPAIELVGKRLKFLKQLNYEYRFDTGGNEAPQQQTVVEYQVYQKRPSKKLESMPFADNPLTIHYA